MPRRPYIAGNWKMNTTPTEARELAAGVKAALEGYGKADVALCPPLVCLAAVQEVVKGTPILLGAQNVFWEMSGAFTGEVSPGMLVASGCQVVLVGHSERRQFFSETDATVNRRIKAALEAKLKPIFCVGELLEERQSNNTEQVVKRQMVGGLAGLTEAQMASVTIAYEPVWAIGTGLTATPQQAQEVHAYIRALLKEQFGTSTADSVRIQYGGSVKADNAAKLLAEPDIDGALVGGASLKAGDFAHIVKAAG